MAEQYEVKLTRRAKRDLDGILHYLLTNHSEQAASNTFKTLTDTIQSLSKMPMRHPRYVKTSDQLPEEIRWVISKKVYKLFFTIEEADKDVLVLRIQHIKISPYAILKSLEEE